MSHRNSRLIFALLLGCLSLEISAFADPSSPSPTSPVNAWAVARFRAWVQLREAPAALDLATLPPGARQLSLQPTAFTPYDQYMGTVRAIIAHLDPKAPSMATACRLMQEGHGFKYVQGDPYYANAPVLTAVEQAGDCKSKALWLFQGLHDPDALFVIGKASKHSRTSHAWVYWRSEDRWWILDCTNRSDPIAADTVTEDRYVPYYSFGRNGAYRHKATFIIENPTASASAPAVGDRAGGRR